VLYFGDIAHAPYGTRAREELTRLTLDGFKLLYDRGATNIVSACNSVSASLALSFFDTMSLRPTQIIEMVGPTVGYFRNSPQTLYLCATPATIRSEIYQNGFRMVGKTVHCVEIPELAGAIEFAADEPKMERIIREAFSTTQIPDGATLILACTHYPLVLDAFRRFLPRVYLFDPADVVADRAERLFWPQEAGNGTTRYLVSKESSHFRELVARVFPERTDPIEVLE
jgi:glutamate racemase